MDVIEFIMNIEKDDDQYSGATPILESEPVSIPDAGRCRVNHGLPAYKARLRSLQIQKREIEERNRKETERKRKRVYRV